MKWWSSEMLSNVSIDVNIDLKTVGNRTFYQSMIEKSTDDRWFLFSYLVWNNDDDLVVVDRLNNGNMWLTESDRVCFLDIFFSLKLSNCCQSFIEQMREFRWKLLIISVEQQKHWWHLSSSTCENVSFSLIFFRSTDQVMMRFVLDKKNDRVHHVLHSSSTEISSAKIVRRLNPV